MNFGILDLLVLLGSVCLFLYGMKLMSEGLQKAAGNRLRNILTLMTNNRFFGLLTGIFITAIVQSSSATTTMIVSFVNANLLSLGQSMAVIFGANIGTTFTAWIISLFGFKVNIAAFSIPLFAVGVPLLFCRSSIYKSWGEFLIGFSLLFLGLDYLNKSVPNLQANPEIFAALQDYANMGYLSVIIFLFVGMILTMIVQASSAVFAIALIMCSKGWIPFEIAAAMVLGSNIGTCITPLLASVSGNVWAKRAAVSHLLFNFFGSVWTILLWYPFLKLVVYVSTDMVGDPNALMSFVEKHPEVNNATFAANKTNILMIQFAKLQFYVSFGLSLFHTIFNIVNVSIMIWLTKCYVRLVTKLVPSKSDDEEPSHLKFISVGMLSTAELSVVQAQKEILHYTERVQSMYGFVKEMFVETNDSQCTKLYDRIQKYESISDRMEVEIATYLTKVSEGRLGDQAKFRIHRMLRIISEIESVADSCNNLSKVLDRKRNAQVVFTDEMNSNIEHMFELLDEALKYMSEILKNPSENISKSQNIEDCINNYRDELKRKNVFDVNEQKYLYDTSVIYMDFVIECEKMGDYIINVVEAVAER